MNDCLFLTRNLKLFNKVEHGNIYLVKSDNFKSQLCEISQFFPDNWMENIFTKCIICSNDLEYIDKKKVKELVPDYIYESKNDFKICFSCEKVYWKGTHIDRIKRELETIFP